MQCIYRVEPYPPLAQESEVNRPRAASDLRELSAVPTDRARSASVRPAPSSGESRTGRRRSETPLFREETPLFREETPSVLGDPEDMTETIEKFMMRSQSLARGFQGDDDQAEDDDDEPPLPELSDL